MGIVVVQCQVVSPTTRYVQATWNRLSWLLIKVHEFEKGMGNKGGVEEGEG